MQSEQQPDYWQKDSNEVDTDGNLEMYTPEPLQSGEDPISVTGENNDGQQKPEIDLEPVHWNASEYIHGDKNKLWFVIFAIVVVGFITTDLLWMKSYTFSILVVVMAVALIIYSRRPPQTVDYTLSAGQGLYIGDRLYHFNEFKAFGLIRDGEHNSIMLIPVKRFSPGVSVYFPEEVGEKIVDILGARLPMENLKLDVVDVIVRKLRL
jgi:hypothetical protein